MEMHEGGRVTRFSTMNKFLHLMKFVIALVITMDIREMISKIPMENKPFKKNKYRSRWSNYE